MEVLGHRMVPEVAATHSVAASDSVAKKAMSMCAHRPWGAAEPAPTSLQSGLCCIATLHLEPQGTIGWGCRVRWRAGPNTCGGVDVAPAATAVHLAAFNSRVRIQLQL